MHPNAELIKRFYEAFARHDAEAMASCYADDVAFSDPAFGPLTGEHARNMWRMLTGRAADLVVVASGIEADDTSGKAHWEATYTFSATGRKVLNIIDAKFTFAGGKITRHDDHFDFWKWSRQALGAPGMLLGWSGFLQKSVQKKALAGLAAFEKKRLAGGRPGPRARGRPPAGAQPLISPSATIAAWTAGRAATRAWKASRLGKSARSSFTKLAQLVTVNR